MKKQVKCELRKSGTREACSILLACVALGSVGCGASETDPNPSGKHASEPGTLRYEITRYFEGLGETGTIIKTPYSAIAEFTGGRRINLPDAIAADRVALRQRYGALPRVFHEELSRDPGGRTYPIGILYAAMTQAVQPLELDRTAELLEVEAVAFTSDMKKRGISPTSTARYAPVVYAEATASAILELAMDERVVRIFDARPQDPEELAVSPIPFHDIDTTFGQPSEPPVGKYATGQKVGWIEAGQTAKKQDAGTVIHCSVYDKHEAFGRAVQDPSNGLRVTYQATGHARIFCA